MMYEKELDKVLMGRARLESKDHTEEDRERILENGLPKKISDPGNFVLHIGVNGTIHLDALADTGASVSVRPYSFYKNLGLGNPRPYHSNLTMANNTQAKAMGEVRNVRIQIGYQAYLADFLVLDIPVDKELPLLLGRPFLRTCGAMIDMGRGTMTNDDGVIKHTYYPKPRAKLYFENFEIDEDEDLLRFNVDLVFYHLACTALLSSDYFLACLSCIELIAVTIKPVLDSQAENPPLSFELGKWTTPTLLWKSKSGIEKKKILRMHGKVYNWETATISFDESDDEDYTVIYDKNSFSYKIFSVDDLKTDLENGNDKVNMPSFPSPKPTVNYFDDLDYFKVFEREFPAIVYNDGLTSKLDFLTEPTVSPQHIDEFNLKDETSLSECDEEEQNVLHFNDLFPFNLIYPDDLKSDKDNDNNKIDIKQFLGGNVINTDDGAYAHGSNKLLETSHDTSNKFFKTETFIKELNVNTVAWNYLNNGMLLNLIKNLYVPFGIPFDPKLFYKDGIKLGQDLAVANKVSWNEGIDARQAAKSAGNVATQEKRQGMRLEHLSSYLRLSDKRDADVLILRQVFVLKIERGEIIERGKLKVAGFSDPRLRTMDRKMYCETCMANMVDCPSHFGHIELAKPMVHIGFMKTVLSCLKPSLQMR
ncbi:hypothetical protein Tco_0223488 [Tanacetum coccineum]